MKKIILFMMIVIALALICSCQCEHTFGEWEITKEASCTASGTRTKTCTKCQETISETIPMAEHSWEGATCSKPKTCKDCGLTEGEPNDHNWEPATCTAAKKCRNCNKRDGGPLGHNYINYVCTRCKNCNITRKDVPNIIDITDSRYSINYVGGITEYLTFVNKSPSKTIKYLYIKLSFYNSVGDIAENEVGGDKESVLRYVGPLAPGASSGPCEWPNVFYCSSFSGTLKVNEILIEYTDGTKLTLDKNVAKDAVVSWR